MGDFIKLVAALAALWWHDEVWDMLCLVYTLGGVL